MERRYLAATLALAATFAVFSHGFRSGYLTKLPHSRAEVRADIACARQYVAEQLMAKLEPYVDRRAPEEAQMVAELNLPEVVRVEQRVVDDQTQAVRQLAHQKCEAALRAQQEKRQVYQMQFLTNDQARQLSDLAIVRAQDLSERAQEWNNLVYDRTQQINMKVMLRAQETGARNLAQAQETAVRNLERAQCALEKSRSKVAHSQTPGMPIHINFVVPATDFSLQVPAPPEPPSSSIY